MMYVIIATIGIVYLAVDFFLKGLTWGTVRDSLFIVGFPTVIAVIAEISSGLSRTKIEEVANQASTRSVGPFPMHIQAIIDLVDHAKHEIVILADCVDYGSFRNFARHSELVAAICLAAKEGRKVKYLVWGDVQPMSRANKYRDADERKNDAHIKQGAKNFHDDVRKLLCDLRAGGHEEKLQPQFQKVNEFLDDPKTDWGTPKGPIAVLQVLQRKYHDLQLKKLADAGVTLQGFLSNTDRNVSTDAVVGTPEEVPAQELFFWIVDEREAMFVVPNYGEDGLAFFTKDRHLVETFMRTFERRWQYAIRHPAMS